LNKVSEFDAGQISDKERMKSIGKQKKTPEHLFFFREMPVFSFTFLLI
jgi:hypothetical protein